MSYTNKTEFYEIPLPIETDLYDPMDYNESMEAVDTVLHGAVQNASTAVSTANSASDAAAAATSGLEALSETVNTEKGKLTALTARVTAAENEIDDVRSDDEDMICAYNEPSATSTHAYAVGDFFIYNNVLYKATDAIAIGDTIVPNTNCAATNVTTEVDAINTALLGKAEKSPTITTILDLTYSTQGNQTVPDFSGYSTLIFEVAGTDNLDRNLLTREEIKVSEFKNYFTNKLLAVGGCLNTTGPFTLLGLFKYVSDTSIYVESASAGVSPVWVIIKAY